jgi:hypothetical protein
MANLTTIVSYFARGIEDGRANRMDSPVAMEDIERYRHGFVVGSAKRIAETDGKLKAVEYVSHQHSFGAISDEMALKIIRCVLSGKGMPG